MAEKKHSVSIPIGKSELITVYDGTLQVHQYKPDPNSDCIIDLTVTEILQDKKGK